jgi:CubicO group peptidase (beta-lactamase class C family)
MDRGIGDRHRRVADCLERRGRAGEFPGAQYVVFDRDGVVDSYAVGLADADAGRPITARARMNVFSTTKVVTAVCLLQLQERGLLRPDSRLLREEARAPLFTTLVHTGKSAFALAWSIGERDGRRFYGHRGGGLGYVSEVRLYPAKGLGSILLMNMTTASRRVSLDVLDAEYLR